MRFGSIRPALIPWLMPALLLVAPSPAQTERVRVSIIQETTFGDSLFLGAEELAILGAGELTLAPKMIPANYPEWTIELDLPPGTTFTPRFYLRADAPGNLANSANGSLIQTGEPITAPGVAQPAARVMHLHAQDDDTVTVRVGEDVFTPSPAVGDWRTVEIPAALVHGPDGLFVETDSAIFPPSGGGLRIHQSEVWFRHGQLFHYQPGEQPPPTPTSLTFQFTPTGFPERTIRVILPRGYNDAGERAYPVLYALDGQNLLSTYTGPRFGSWDLDLTINELVRRGEMPEVILVGIDNTNIRHVEYVPSWGEVFGDQGRGEEFLAALRDELVPEVEARYRVLGGPEQRVYLGSSLGGLSGFEVAHQHRDTWGTVVAMSPSTQINTAKWMEYAVMLSSHRARIWIDSGTAGTSADGYPNTTQLRDTLLTSGGEALGPRFHHSVGLGDSHNEAAWRRRSPAALRWAYLPREVRDSAAAVWLLYEENP